MKKAAVVFLLAAVFILGWSFRYRYDHVSYGVGLARTNIYTGKSQVLTPSGWKPIPIT